MEGIRVWKNGGERAVQEGNGNRMTRDGKGTPKNGGKSIQFDR
jgi:hypothetical protein